MRWLAAIALIVASAFAGFLAAWSVVALDIMTLPAGWDAQLSQLDPLLAFWVWLGIWPVALVALSLMTTIGWLRPKAQVPSPWDSTPPRIDGARIAWGIVAALAIVGVSLPVYWLAAAMTLLAQGPG